MFFKVAVRVLRLGPVGPSLCTAFQAPGSHTAVCWYQWLGIGPGSLAVSPTSPGHRGQGERDLFLLRSSGSTQTHSRGQAGRDPDSSSQNQLPLESPLLPAR